MSKLTDTQLAILSEAAQDPECRVTIPDRLRGGAVAKVVGPLLAKGLVEEAAHRPGLVAYRPAEDGSQLSLVITDAGLEALGIEIEPAAELPVEETREGPAPTRTPRSGTKQALLIGLLERPEGATIDEVIATGWQPHTVRGAISGALKKRLGMAITSEKVEERGRVYRVQPSGTLPISKA